MGKTLDEFYKDFISELQIRTDVKGDSHSETVFTEFFVDYLEDLGETDGIQICNHMNPHFKTKLSGYSLNEDGTRIDLYIVAFKKSSDLVSMKRNELNDVINAGLNFYNESKDSLLEYLEESTDEYDVALAINKDRGNIKTIGINIFSNQLINAEGEEVYQDDVNFEIKVWDIERIYQIVLAEENHETIRIDFAEPIPCLEIKNESYDSYLLIFDAIQLAEIYEKYKLRLLERNVRAFLQVKGKVNIGLKNTLANEPDLFFAYNNGISAIASKVGIFRQDQKTYISSIDGLQIVNGGQTTASIHHAYYLSKFDLSNVKIQMKLTRIRNSEEDEEIYLNISRYANTQNAIQLADMSSNSPFHKKIEEFSRSIEFHDESNDIKFKWYYERVRGQYQEYLKRSKLEFGGNYPKEYLFTKLELAKYEMSWEQRPDVLSKGQMYCFQTFMQEYVQPENKSKKNVTLIPDEDYFRNLIAEAILFREGYKIIKSLGFPSYANNIVAYTISMVSFLTHKRLDMQHIANHQKIDQKTHDLIKLLAPHVRESIITNSGSENISSFCKKYKCWEMMIKDSESWEIDEVVQSQKLKTNSLNKSNMDSSQSNLPEVLKEMYNTSPKLWFALSVWGKETNNLNPWERQFCFGIGRSLSRKYELYPKQIESCVRILKKAQEAGFLYLDAS